MQHYTLAFFLFFAYPYRRNSFSRYLKATCRLFKCKDTEIQSLFRFFARFSKKVYTFATDLLNNSR